MRKITRRRTLKRRIKPWYTNNLGKIYLSECTKILSHYKNNTTYPNTLSAFKTLFAIITISRGSYGWLGVPS